MSAIAIAVVGTGLVSAYMNSQAAENATAAQVNAANAATSVAQGNYAQNREDLAPYREAGRGALSQLTQQLPDMNRSFSAADFREDPGYQFRMDEGNKAIERSASARGGIGGGATMKALTRFSQGTASDEYNNAYNRFNNDRSNRFNRLAAVSGIGQTATNTGVAAGGATAAAIGQNINAAGNANAANQVAQANNVTSALNGGMNTWMQSQYANRSNPNLYANGGSGGYGSSSTYVNPASGWNPGGN